jgi:hypothetical protein
MQQRPGIQTFLGELLQEVEGLHKKVPSPYMQAEADNSRDWVA